MAMRATALAISFVASVSAFAPAGRIGVSLVDHAPALAQRAAVVRAGLSLSKAGQQRHNSLSIVGLRAAAYPTNHPGETEPLKVQVVHSTTSAEDYAGDHLVVPVLEPENKEDKEALAQLGISSAVDAKLDGVVADLIASTEFKGKAGSASTCRLAKGSSYKQLSIAGAGKKDGMDSGVAAKLGKQVAAIAKADKKAKSIAVLLPEGSNSTHVGKFTDALLGGLYVDSRFKTGDGKPKPLALEKVEILGCSSDGVDAAVSDAGKMVRGVTLCKDLVASPPNYCTPSKLADVAKEIAKETGLDCKILEKDECEKLGMGSYLAVARGSTEPPKFIHLTYKPSGETKKTVAVVGKGLTFDSGGYNIKAGPGSMIELMKFDMGGSAATLGSALAVGLMKPAGVECHWIVAACENMVNGEAMRPGDILTASNGKTIEVLNTDAEGRLTLADGLVYAEKQGATEIIDIATLTGACIVSLGGDYAGLWSNNETMAQSIKDSSAATGEKLWHMPLCEESYGEALKSKIADLANIGGKGGGSITAALFLKEFVNKSSWAHLDIAGPVWSDKEGGATGYGVRTLTDWITSRGK